ncbi:DUF2691 family protein [Sporosarcina sp. ZBG7A]|uniref:DUF2691 family protein n=1 Tax=Sporosarcina sp. ZBG7A TaxID=1582223 RepID=UPI00057B7508|nr:DUF2691 family protein [Sporosarcina sp. ZBG7A]
MQGIIFDIRNGTGNQLYELLNGMTEPSWYWRTGPGESYFAGYEKRFFSLIPLWRTEISSLI